MTDDFLDQLQADVLGILSNTPSLSLARKISDDQGSLEGEIENHLATTNDDSGKCGLAVIILAVEVEKADENLPGPPLQVRVDVQILEQVDLNRDPTNGTLIHSATAATRVLSALQHVTLGSCLLYAGKNPIRPLPLRTGFVGHIVSVRTMLNGAAFVSRPLGVEASMIETGALTPGNTLVEHLASTTAPDLIYTGDFNGRGDYRSAIYTMDGIFPTGWRLYWNGSSWRLEYRTVGDVWYAAQSPDDVTTPDLAVFAAPTTGTGLAEFTLSSGSSSLTLNCASPSSSIRYTTDGSYPSPDKTLYTAPIASPQTGTLFRAAAYVAGMPPGDVLEFTVTD